MAGYKNKKDCPCDSPIKVFVDKENEIKYFPCCRCDTCIARMQLWFSNFINGEDEK